ncbi:YcxB family protein [Pasteurella atlantica]|uniref:YcxB family protein n=2 Tax=Pasteurellaceae TaxID=712 RepID=A0ACC6HNE9_9PAST|nr:YcxB family protein [Pasteurella atlantica]MDP8052307.1 YcxB family protein [Pasteurella atlantica]MDP8101609.1 YcxB family protein [Pasteurella atlantica]MDP8105140.1 YcxB family protein [Pasteurella atlantica]MDP8148625.1 YcxB family protein [Pasteurella atlantica]
MHIQIKGKATFDEYLEVQKILKGKRMLISQSIIFVCGVALLGIALSLGELSGFSIAFGCIGIVYILYALIFIQIRFRYAIKKHWKNYPKMHKEMNMTILDDGVQSLDDKNNPSHLNWNNFINIKESEHLFLLYLSPSLCIFIPKRLISPQEIEPLRLFLFSQITPQSN